jgi:hypothetical protein
VDEPSPQEGQMKREVLYNELRTRHGKLDDIVVSEGDMQLEQMDELTWWLGFYKGKKRITFWIHASAPVAVTLIEDDLHLKRVEQEKEVNNEL